MGKIYVVRHGQTQGNINRLMYGREDIDLTETGKEQARKTRELLKGVKFDLVFCSPLIRTKHTMEIINEKNVQVNYDDRILERDCGEFQGLTFEQMDRESYWNYHQNLQYERAENIQALFARVYAFLEEIKQKNSDKTILIVTHDGIAKVIKCYFKGIPEDGNLLDLGLKNCEVAQYEWK